MSKDELSPEEMPAQDDQEFDDVVDTDDDPGYSPDFLAAVKRIIYGTESLLETVEDIWSDEVGAILEDIEEAKRAWPTKDGC